MGVFDLFGPGWSIERVPAPWDDRPAIFTRAAGSGDLGSDPAAVLAPGERDGLLVGAESDAPLRARQLAVAMRELLERADEGTFARFYQLLVAGQLLPVLASFLDDVTRPDPNDARWIRLARRLAAESPDREAVKLGIVMLGADLGSASTLAMLDQLARHDELALYVGMSLRSGGTSDLEILELAKRAGGWGRILLIRLLGDTVEREVKRWFVTEGYRNVVPSEHAAIACATSGELCFALERALDAKERDRALLRGATEILAALARGKAVGLDDYSAAYEALRDLADLLARHGMHPELLPSLRTIADHLAGPGAHRAHAPELAARYRHFTG